MVFMPFQIVGVWLRGLLAIAVLAAGIFLLRDWWQHRYTYVIEPAEREIVVIEADAVAPADRERPVSARQVEYVRRVDWQFGFNRETLALLGGLALLGYGIGGGSIGRRFVRRLRAKSGTSPELNEPAPRPISVERIRRPDGTEIHAEVHGSLDRPVMILTHGWGLDSAEWRYAIEHLGGRYRLIVWDLPGLGKSAAPQNDDWSLEKLARDLDAVLALAGGRPALLVGHSIGGMIALTHGRLFPEAQGSRVSGLVLVHSTYTNPVRTTNWAGLYTALQKPLLEPILHLTIWLSPLVRVMNWLSYLNGSAHRSTERTSFSGKEATEQLDFMARYVPPSPPAVLANGMLAMFRYDATAVLPRIAVPTLVVAADQDTTCTPAASILMSRVIPGAELTTLESARHCGHFEHNREFLNELDEFASRLSVRRVVVNLTPMERPAELS
jgi:pimeloyl-ACP methyl ester carboxylesterase